MISYMWWHLRPHMHKRSIPDARVGTLATLACPADMHECTQEQPASIGPPLARIALPPMFTGTAEK